MRIGIANDSPTAAEALRRALAAAGEHQVAWVARTGADAVRLCRDLPPDLVLMDLAMPVLDGVEATRRIMRDAPCAILIVTAAPQDNVGQVFRALGAGALDVTATPVLLGRGGEDALLAKIRTIAKLIAATPAAPPPAPAAAPAAASPARSAAAPVPAPAAPVASAPQPAVVAPVAPVALAPTVALPTSLSAAVALVQGRLIATLTDILQRGASVPTRSSTPAATLAPYSGPDAALLELQREAIGLALEVLGTAPASPAPPAAR